MRSGEVALALAVGPILGWRRRLAALLATFGNAPFLGLGSPSRFLVGGGFGFRLQFGLRGTDLGQPLLPGHRP